MLCNLRIKNYILIEDVNVDFSSNFNVITGETGAGKSIFIGALKILLGKRPEGEIIRSNFDKSIIEGEFKLTNKSLIKRFNNEYGCEIEDGDLYLKRIFSRDGKNKCYLNGNSVPVNIIKKIGSQLVNFYGQHDFMLLFNKNYQLNLLDNYSGAKPLLDDYKSSLADYGNIVGEIEKIENNMAIFKEKEDLFNYQLEELEGADLKVSEEDKLQNDLRILENMESINSISYELFEIIYNTDNSILNKIAYITKKVAELNKFDSKTEPLSNLINEAQINIEEMSQYLKDYTGNLEYNPGNVDYMRGRLEKIYKLKSKYNMSVAELIAMKNNLEEKVSSISGGSFDINKLNVKLKKVHGKLLVNGKKLTVKRKKGAELLEVDINSRLSDVGMKGASLSIKLINCKNENAVYSAHGLEDVDILLKSNPGEIFKSLSQIISGGEISRLMLILKSIIVEDSIDLVMVFDEIDVGISGKVAQEVGEKVKSIAQHNQVISITHLPQVASYGNHHLAVRKNQSKNNTTISIEVLDETGKREEIASLLRGKEKTEASYKHAEELIKNSR